MKKLLVITLILLGYQLVTIGQNWDLFPKGQYSMYELTFSNQPTLIERLVKDSTAVNKDSILSYFNSKIINEADCSMKINRKDVKQEYAPTYLMIDSCGEKDNWQYFNFSDSNGGVQFKFNTKAKVNETWAISDNMSFTCNLASLQMVFGQLDSVKYFSNSKVNIPFVLSKTFGLIEFAPFSQLISSITSDITRVKLIGCEKDGIKKGVTIPDFNDFFHLNKGDVVFWHYYEENFNNWEHPTAPIDYYYKDSITNSTITADSVIYEISTIRGKSIIKSTQKFYRDKFTKFTNAASSAGIFTDENPGGRITYDYWYWQAPVMKRKDGVFSVELVWSSLFIRNYDCRLSMIIDYGGEYFSFDTRVGLSAYNHATAVGAIINGEKWGMTKIPTAISTMEDASFKVYPNPVSDKIMIQSKVAGKLDYRLFNSNGQLVKAGQITNQTIEVAELPDGLYYLQVGNEKMQEIKKIIKVNKP